MSPYQSKDRYMSVTCKFNGRLGNIVFNICQVIAYCKKYDLQYWFPKYAWACTNGIPTISVPDTGPEPTIPTVYHEPVIDGYPFYHDIPRMDNVEFNGYYQSFKYFEDYRQDILDVFNLPNEMNKGMVGVHVRMGDCIGQEKAFPIAPWEYYDRSIQHMVEKGYTNYLIFSDSIEYCIQQFTAEHYPGCTFEFRTGYSELEDYQALVQCEHIITARSTFSLTAGWMNQNPDKIILCPQITFWWLGQNRDMFTGTENWLTPIAFLQHQLILS